MGRRQAEVTIDFVDAKEPIFLYCFLQVVINRADGLFLRYYWVSAFCLTSDFEDMAENSQISTELITVVLQHKREGDVVEHI